MAVQYDTTQFLLKSMLRLFVNAFFIIVMVGRGWYRTLFELKIPDFLHNAPDFCMQRQKTAEVAAKCLNSELRSLIYRLVISKSVEVASS